MGRALLSQLQGTPGAARALRPVAILALCALWLCVAHIGIAFADPASLTVTTTPNDAQVSLDSAPALSAAPLGTVVFENLSAATHALAVSRSGYDTLGANVTLADGENATFSATLTAQAPPANGTLTVSTVPGGADISLDGTPAGTTGAVSGNLTIPNVAPGSHTVVAQKSGYNASSQGATVTAGAATVVHLTLAAQQNASSGSASIVNRSTNVTGSHMFSTDSARFSVTLGAPGTITWAVDGVTQRTSSGTSDTFVWAPGLLFTSGTKSVTVTATTSSDSASWPIAVEYVLNPYFSALDGSADVVGSASTQLHVFTNDHALTPTSLSVTLENTQGSGTRTTYALAPSPNPATGEIDWRTDIGDILAGDNFIVLIEADDNSTGVHSSFTLGHERGHSRTLPSTGSSGGSGNPPRESRGGGGGIFDKPQNDSAPVPTLVYALFAKDVVGEGENETLSADVSIGAGGAIAGVEATVRNPNGTLIPVTLRLAQGTSSYGTWSANISATVPGKYTLASMSARDAAGKPYDLSPQAASFYLTSDTAGNERLMLVYSTLGNSTVQNGSSVTLRLDARDAVGLLGVSAGISTSKGDAFEVPLRRVAGSAQYGTWEATIDATSPDTTVRIENVTLRNAEASRTYPLADRSFYIEGVAQQAGADAERNAAPFWSLAHLRDAMKDPLLPTLVGFALMLVTMGFIFVTRRLRHRIGE